MGMILFLIMGLANGYNLYETWSFKNTSLKIAALAGVAFNFLLLYFFYHLYKQVKPQVKFHPDKEKLDEIISKIERRENEN